jgi:hypothetical protein
MRDKRCRYGRPDVQALATSFFFPSFDSTHSSSFSLYYHELKRDFLLKKEGNIFIFCRSAIRQKQKYHKRPCIRPRPCRWVGGRSSSQAVCNLIFTQVHSVFREINVMFLFLGPGEIMLKFTCCRLNQFVLILNTTEIDAVWNFKMLVDNTCWLSVCFEIL